MEKKDTPPPPKFFKILIYYPILVKFSMEHKHRRSCILHSEPYRRVKLAKKTGEPRKN